MQLIHFQGNTWSLTSDEAASSESDCQVKSVLECRRRPFLELPSPATFCNVQYEHIRLKSVHERKATPHQIATPDPNTADDEDPRDLSALLSQAFPDAPDPDVIFAPIDDTADDVDFDHDAFLVDNERKRTSNKSKHRVRVSITNVDFAADAIQPEEEYVDDSDDGVLGTIRQKSEFESNRLSVKHESHSRGVSWGTVTRIELDYAIDSDVAKNTKANNRPALRPHDSLPAPVSVLKNTSVSQPHPNRQSSRGKSRGKKVRMQLKPVASDNPHVRFRNRRHQLIDDDDDDDEDIEDVDVHIDDNVFGVEIGRPFHDDNSHGDTEQKPFLGLPVS